MFFIKKKKKKIKERKIGVYTIKILVYIIIGALIPAVWLSHFCHDFPQVYTHQQPVYISSAYLWQKLLTLWRLSFDVYSYNILTWKKVQLKFIRILMVTLHYRKQCVEIGFEDLGTIKLKKFDDEQLEALLKEKILKKLAKQLEVDKSTISSFTHNG